MVEHPEETISLAQLAPGELTLDIYHSLVDFEKAVTEDHLETAQFGDNALQISIDSILTEDQVPVPDPVANTSS